MPKISKSVSRVWIPLAVTAILAFAAVSLGQDLQQYPQQNAANNKPSNAPRVTTSVAVWADIAAQVGGPSVVVTALISKPGQDPHSYVATARDQLAVNQADLTIANGIGYDTFFASLTVASGKTASGRNLVIGCHAGCDGNPHVWYSLGQVGASVPRIAKALARVSGTRQPILLGQKYRDEIAQLQKRMAKVRESASGKGYLLTEGFASYFLNDLGMADATPLGFKTAVENEQDASPLVMNQIRDLLRKHQVSVVVTNNQTTNSQTLQIASWAKDRGVPVLGWSELLPAHRTYLQWMSANLNQLRGALK